VKEYFGCGSIRFSKRDQTFKYEVRSLKDLVTAILPHFWKYPLLSSKMKDFVVFSKVCEFMIQEKHRTIKGLVEIIDLAITMNVNGSRRYSKEYLITRLKI